MSYHICCGSIKLNLFKTQIRLRLRLKLNCKLFTLLHYTTYNTCDTPDLQQWLILMELVLVVVLALQHEPHPLILLGREVCPCPARLTLASEMKTNIKQTPSATHVSLQEHGESLQHQSGFAANTSFLMYCNRSRRCALFVLIPWHISYIDNVVIGCGFDSDINDDIAVSL